jgi:hypothetical protein
MPYSFPVTTLAPGPNKVFTVNSFSANCTAKSTWVYIDATFDNVCVVSAFLTPSCLRLSEVSILWDETTAGRIVDEVAWTGIRAESERSSRAPS